VSATRTLALVGASTMILEILLARQLGTILGSALDGVALAVLVASGTVQGASDEQIQELIERLEAAEARIQELEQQLLLQELYQSTFQTL
jgi:transposase